MNDTRYKKRKKKGRLRIKRLIMIIVIFTLVPVSSYFAFVAYKTYEAAEKSYNELERGNQSKLREKEVKINTDPVSILLVGLENYTTNYTGGRTDTLMVATFNPELKTMKLLSIPRDTYVYIEAEGKNDKITHAYGAGGRDETIRTVEDFLDIPIDYYVEVNFDGFKEIVDEVGGIEVEVPFDFTEWTDTHPRKQLSFEEGSATLDGLEALAYARMRKQDPRGDFGRNDRQKEVIKALVDKLSSPSNVLKIDELASHLGENVQTNMKMSDPLYFFKKYKGFSSNNIETLRFDGENSTINGIYYFEADEQSLASVKSDLQTHLEYQGINDN
ncbi:LCP family protein [Mesobacillus harenae]|uniref:LCP family protein n=1 Tax=Mesobacillus harenae TaxID=2213203 RepID=UPI001580169C|nr:LCP family protein [Mesobacillus harenae]